MKVTGGSAGRDKMQRRVVDFKATYWRFEDSNTDDDSRELTILIGGIDRDLKTVFIRVRGFTPFVYLQLPTRVRWDKHKANSLFEYFKKRMKSDAPKTYRLQTKFLLHYKEKVKVMFLSFPTFEATKKFFGICSRGRISVYNVGTFSGTELRVHEHNIDPILKFASCRGLKLAGWIRAKEMRDILEKNFTTADIDMVSFWKDISAIPEPEGVIIKPKYCSFDIECYSKNHNSKLPDPEVKENEVFQISMVFGRLGEENMEKILLSLYDPLDIDGAEVRRYKTEKELLLDFTQLVQDKNPDLMLGYNIMKFDWHYLITRSDVLGIYLKFAMLSRLLNERASRDQKKWSSSAYGKQVFQYFDCHGRINVDVLLEVERNYKLPKYSLDKVSEYFLKKHKEDVTPRELFMLYQLTKELTELSRDEDNFVKVKKRALEILVEKKVISGTVKRYREDLENSTAEDINYTIRKALQIVGIYCVKDTVLPLELSNKLVLWTTMEEMSNCMHIPTSYLHTRGQQIKVLAQVYRETLFNNIVIPYHRKSNNPEDDEKYQGAIVVEANRGFYKNVATLDFASLYPTTMIAYNICYTTLLKDDDPTPDEDCHVIAFEDHVACIAKDSKITLSNRSKRIQNLNENFQVQAWNGKGTANYDQTGFFYQGEKECVSLLFEDGTVLECTPDHRILTKNYEWIEAQDLEINQEILMAYQPPEYQVPSDYKIYFGDRTFKGEMLIKLVQLIGLICTDGHLVKGRSMIYVGHKLDILSVQEDLKELFETVVCPRKENYGWSFSILGKYGEAFRSLEGISLETKAPGRSVPNFVLREDCPEGVICAFLSGMFGGDGHTITYSKKAGAFSPISFSWSSGSPEELKDVFNKIKSLLEIVGFHPMISRAKNETKLRLPINETVKFQQKIGFAHCVHKAIRLEAGCLYLKYRQNVWGQQKRIVDYVRDKRQILRKERKRYSMDDLIQEAKNQEKIVFHKYYCSPSSRQMTVLLNPKKKWEKPMFSKEYFPGPMEYMEKIGAKELFSENGDVMYAVSKDKEYLPVFKIPLIGRKSIGKRPTYDLEVDESHSFIANGVIVHNCIHDPQKRKRKKSEVLCGKHRYRFKKVKPIIHEDGRIERLNEGILPRLERNLLSERKTVKKEMFKMQARLKMQRGEADSEEIEKWKSWGLDVISKGELSDEEEKILEITCNVLNARQLALKISANSVGGNTPVPCKIKGKFRYEMIENLFDKVDKIDGENEFSFPEDIQIWSDKGWTPVKYVVRHQVKPLTRVLTHTGCVDVTSDHSLLNEKGQKVKVSEVNVGHSLLHHDLPLPLDTPLSPKFRKLSDEDIRNFNFETKEERIAFVHGLFLAEGTCGLYGAGSTAKSSWIIYNEDKSLLERARDILNDYEENEFHVYDPGWRKTMNPGSKEKRLYHVYQLRSRGKIKLLAQNYRISFYNHRKEKKVPDYILSAPYNTRLAFFVGYYSGDGNRYLKTGIVIINKGQQASAGLFFLMRSLGYKVSISYSKVKNHIDHFRLQCCIKFRIGNKIKRIEEAPIPPPIKNTEKEIIRNEVKIERSEDGSYQYKGIKIVCQRLPRQKLLDSLDRAQMSGSNRGRIVRYEAKKVMYRCDTCGQENTAKIRTIFKEAKTPKKVCACKSPFSDTTDFQKYVKPTYKEYVYDVETENHHFAAGVGNMIVHNSIYGACGAKNGFIPLIPGAASVTAMGRWLITKAIDRALKGWSYTRLVYGDTDSCMLFFKNKTLRESFDIAEEISHVVTHYLKCCILEVDENFTVDYVDSDSGEKTLLRLDQVKEYHYKGLSENHLLKALEYRDNPIDLEFENMYGKFLLLTKKRYIAYVVNKDGVVTSITKKGVVMARRDNCKFLRDSYREISSGILDERDQEEIMGMLYDRIHSLFTRQVKDDDLIIYVGVKDIKEYAKKRTSDEVSSDTNPFLDKDGKPIQNVTSALDDRLVYRNIPQCLLGLKMLRRGDIIPPNTRFEIIYVEEPNAEHQGDKAEDYTYYRENRLIEYLRPDPLHYLEKQLTKPLTELVRVRYPPKAMAYEKLEDALDRVLSTLEPLHRHRIANVRTFKKPRPGLEDKFYLFKGKRAKVEFLLASADKGGANEIDKVKDAELIDVCKRWKCRDILNRLYKQKKVKKRPTKRPYRNGNELPNGMDIMLMRGHGGYPSGTICKVVDVVEDKGRYIYTLVVDNKEATIIKNVPREHISTFIYKDGSILTDIFKARQGYKEVVTDLKRLFIPVVFVE